MSCLLFLVVLLATAAGAAPRPSIRLIALEDLKYPSPTTATSTSPTPSDDSPEWEDFLDPETKSLSDLDSGSWQSVLDPAVSNVSSVSDPREASYLLGLRGLILGDVEEVDDAVRKVESASAEGFAHAQSVMGFVYGAGVGRERSRPKALLHHSFAASGGNVQSKMALAYSYFRHSMHDKAVKFYSELAESAVASFMISKNQPVIEIIRIHSGGEENREALKENRGEAEEGVQVVEHQALRANPGAMYSMGMFYYFGLRGLRRDYAKALYWFSKAADKAEPRSMELLGEIYASGAGVEKNYTRALEWFTLASQKKHFSAYNGLGYLYVRGYGVEKKNFSRAKLYFEKAARNEEVGGFYNLGVLYLKGIGVKRDVDKAIDYFVKAGRYDQPKAIYQLAKMFHEGIGLKRNLAMATLLYKKVAERGPWSSLSTWALEFYTKGYVGEALLLYLRMAELGYEVAQSNAAWILDKYGEHSMCIGKSGLCTGTERHLLQHSLWWQASEQGNEHAALLIGDAYYYGRGMERDYERAAEAYMRAKSQGSAQAMFNLGYMHERGEGLPLDLHLAKRYYDQALESDPDAKLPVTLARASLWLRKNYADSFLLDVIDSLPENFSQIQVLVEEVIFAEGNSTILTLFVCLLTVLYLRGRQRRHALILEQQDDGERIS